MASGTGENEMQLSARVHGIVIRSEYNVEWMTDLTGSCSGLHSNRRRSGSVHSPF